MSGNFYLPVRDVMQLTGLGKSQVYNMIKMGNLMAHSEVVGGDSRHKVLASSVMVALAYREEEHRKKANRMKLAYEQLERIVKHHG